VGVGARLRDFYPKSHWRMCNYALFIVCSGSGHRKGGAGKQAHRGEHQVSAINIFVLEELSWLHRLRRAVLN